MAEMAETLQMRQRMVAAVVVVRVQLFSVPATPATNITTRTLNGLGGRNNAGGTFADNAAGSNNVGIFNSSFSLLPKKIISFKGKKPQTANTLDWTMVNEAEISYYEVQRSYDGTNFETIGTVQKNSSAYAFSDNSEQTKIFTIAL